MEKRDVQFSAIHALQSRFLYPFFFRRQKAHEAVKALREVSLAGRDGQRLDVWGCPTPHALYKEEMLEHVVKFLFPCPDTAGCQYLKLSDAVGSRWFGHLEVQLPGNVMVPLRLVAAAGVELFLSDYGVGILSIALESHKGDLSAVEAAEFNYRLSQLRCNNLILHVPHPAEDAQRWARLSTETQQNILPAPDPQAPLEARLGKPGGVFTPREMVDTLLQPLTAFDLRQVQDRLSVYTVVRCGAEVDFERQEVRASYAPLLSALAQVEESTHAGAPTDALGITHIILNRRHWAGVGLLGAVHLIADQPPPEHWEVALVLSASADVYLIADQSPPEHPFNTARTLRIFLKYFMPYLSALLQRHTLHYIAGEASGTTPPIAHGSLLEFAVVGHFTHVSTREALHRYYRLCQEGLDVQHALDNARRAISALDAKHTTMQQIQVAKDTATNVAATRELQKDMRKHLHTMAHVQVMVEFIEIFLVSVYAAHLWHMFVGHHREHKIWLDSEKWGLPLWSWGVLFWALLAGGIAAWCLRPWRHWGITFWTLLAGIAARCLRPWHRHAQHTEDETA